MNLSTFAQYYSHPMMGYDGWGLMMLFWTALIVIGVLLALRSLKDGKSVDERTADPLGIAKERYAKGDITKAQFDQLKKDLTMH